MNQLQTSWRTLATLAALLTMPAVIWAKSISEQQAQSIASTFMLGKTLKVVSPVAVHSGPRRSQAAHPAYYVFNTQSSKGYVIVSGDDRTEPILGYSDDGSFDAEHMPPALQHLLEGYAAQIAALDEGAAPVRRTIAAGAIFPLLTSLWGQNAPYNNQMPTYNSQNCVTGCVATSMAQVMYFHKWPSRPSTTIPAYTTSSLGISVAALSPVDFNWSAMKDYHAAGNGTGEQAVATLNRYCAQSVEMNCTPSSSGASDHMASIALVKYFDYASSVSYVMRKSFTQDEWELRLINELQNSRPVMYAGRNTSGHSFVCDGYDGQGRYHINWGWNGTSNGYYLLNLLNPPTQGTGGSTAAYGYINEQSMIIGIKPQDNVSSTAPLFCDELTTTATEVTRNNTSAHFYIPYETRVFNMGTVNTSYEFSFGLYDESGNELDIHSYIRTLSNLDPLSGNRLGGSIVLGSTLTTGRYFIRPVYRLVGDSQWLWCNGADVNYIVMDVNGTTAAIGLMGKNGQASYVFNEASFDGVGIAGRKMKLTANLTNTGGTANDQMYLFVNNSNVATSLASIAPGQSGDVTFDFTAPSSGGTYTAQISLNSDGSNPIGTCNFTVSSAGSANLTAQLTVLNSQVNSTTLKGNNFRVKATLKNNLTSAYNNEVMFRVLRMTSSTSGALVETINKPANITGNGQVEISVTSDRLAAGPEYRVILYYYNGTSEVQCAMTPAYTFDGSSLTPVQYVDASGMEQQCTDYTVLSGGTTQLTDGWYVVNSNLTFADRIKISGTAHIILADGKTLNANQGIEVDENEQLNIYGQFNQTGALTATSSSGNAGIGGNCHWSSGTIVINGGVVTATGSEQSAGIGGGDQGYWSGEFGGNGTVIINGGKVTAHAPGYGAGIGGGGEDRNNSSIKCGRGGTITINGGQVKATSVNGYGMGPGKGYGNTQDGTDGTIYLSWKAYSDFVESTSYKGATTFDKTFVLTGTNTIANIENAAAKQIDAAFEVTFKTDQNQTIAVLGCKAGEPFPAEQAPKVDGKARLWLFQGQNYDFETPVTSNLTLIAGAIKEDIPYITAEGNEATVSQLEMINANTTEIGQGKWYVVMNTITNNNRISVDGTAHIILTDGASLTATKGLLVPWDSQLHIYGQKNGTGQLTATGYQSGAGIGGNVHGSSGTIEINGGVVTATGDGEAAGIGGGDQGFWSGEYGHNRTVIINGGKVTAHAPGFGAGIGGGGEDQSASSVKCGHGGTIVINGGQVKATSVNGYGMGPGRGLSYTKDGDDGTIGLSWRNAGDFIEASSYHGSIELTKVFALDASFDKADVGNIDNQKINAAYAVTFLDNNKSDILAERASPVGKSFPAHEAPEYAGVTWLSISDNAPYDFDRFVTADVTLYADRPVGGGVTGDVDGNGMVDIADINAVVNILLGKNVPADYPGNADINGTGAIDIADVNALINILLGKN